MAGFTQTIGCEVFTRLFSEQQWEARLLMIPNINKPYTVEAASSMPPRVSLGNDGIVPWTGTLISNLPVFGCGKTFPPFTETRNASDLQAAECL